MRLFRPETVSARPIKDRETFSSATNNTYTQPDASVSDLASFAEPSKRRGDATTAPTEERTIAEVVATWRRLKSQPVAPYTPKPGGIAARALAMVRKPSKYPPSSAAPGPRRASGVAGLAAHENKDGTEAFRSPSQSLVAER